MPKLTAKQVETLTDFGKYDDGDGLRLVIRKSGKAWVLRYQLAGKRKEIGLGPYPRYGLKEARSRADTHRALIRDGIDPLVRKAETHQEVEELPGLLKRKGWRTLSALAP
ncbi:MULTISPECIES: Arm DNA-binding domain-containing protein [Pseudomonas]|uniref:Arm DNA-binding domain-containing protein n=1 Tax=Pseudomonas TaxID=286 RepID=UPI000FB66997|nr:MULTISPECIES: Arm DNA-binding domain-containing protein [Pseudomonas]MCK2121370.1 Arm DNA-binding domain-containing protein [Pseudomonas sp. PNPG3]MCX2695038.1 Arm DNA-binding domain-containing protein [Pseudomonas sp. DCB_BZ]MCX2709346.1 Arm DNA-binding domain-containing protein [Pseudomonas sp. DCB_BG]MCX2815719.1 Arm DNA-binding domain-containing protein [Pseudomonas sp. DCB_E]MCX2860122.1 Arm DNA-binding domain-containing protein [Pseudomonas sp. DCB_CB]